jgi:cell division protein FtsB
VTAGGRPSLLPRPKFTGRAAVLAIALCAVALTLAYPVRQYIADRRQLDQLAAANARLAIQVRQERAEAQALRSPTVIEQEARDDLQWCFPSQTCYEVIFPAAHHGSVAAAAASTPWYGRLWESVKAADGTSHR